MDTETSSSDAQGKSWLSKKYPIIIISAMVGWSAHSFVSLREQNAVLAAEMRAAQHNMSRLEKDISELRSGLLPTASELERSGELARLVALKLRPLVSEDVRKDLPATTSTSTNINENTNTYSIIHIRTKKSVKITVATGFSTNGYPHHRKTTEEVFRQVHPFISTAGSGLEVSIPTVENLMSSTFERVAAASGRTDAVSFRTIDGPTRYLACGPTGVELINPPTSEVAQRTASMVLLNPDADWTQVVCGDSDQYIWIVEDGRIGINLRHEKLTPQEEARSYFSVQNRVSDIPDYQLLRPVTTDVRANF